MVEAIANLVEVCLKGVSQISSHDLFEDSDNFPIPAAIHHEARPWIDQQTARSVHEPSPMFPTKNILVIATRTVVA